MNEDLQRAIYRILLDGQAYLYAQHMKLTKELYGHEATEKELEQWQDEWKEEASELIERLIGDAKTNDHS